MQIFPVEQYDFDLRCVAEPRYAVTCKREFRILPPSNRIASKQRAAQPITMRLHSGSQMIRIENRAALEGCTTRNTLTFPTRAVPPRSAKQVATYAPFSNPPAMAEPVGRRRFASAPANVAGRSCSTARSRSSFRFF